MWTQFGRSDRGRFLAMIINHYFGKTHTMNKCNWSTITFISITIIYYDYYDYYLLLLSVRYLLLIGLLMDTWTSTKTKISSVSIHSVVPGKHLSISRCRFCFCLLIFPSRLPIFKISSFQSFLLIFNIHSTLYYVYQ